MSMARSGSNVKHRKQELLRTLNELAPQPSPAKAIKLIDSYLKQVDQYDDDLIILKGNILDSMGRPTEAVKCYRKAYKINSQNPQTLIELGDYYVSYHQQKFQQALQYYNKSIGMLKSKRMRSADQIDRFIVANLRRAEALVELNKPLDAMKSIVRVLCRYPTDSRLGSALLRVQEQNEKRQRSSFK